MAPSRRRRVHLLVSDGEGRVLVDGEARLPDVAFELGPDETTVAAVSRLAADRWALQRPLLEVRFQEDVADGEDAAAETLALAVFEPPAGDGVAPEGLHWQTAVETSPLPPVLRRRADIWRAEWRGAASPDTRRARWSQPGWYDRLSGWVATRLAELGRHPTGTVEQWRHWSISALLRVETDGGRVWAKAVFPGFAHEPAVSALLHQAAAGTVAPVLALDAAEGWLLLDDIGSAVVSERPDRDEDAIRRLVALQRAFVGRAGELRAAGVPTRPFAALPDQLTDTLLDAELRPWLDIGPDRAAAIVSWVGAAARDAAALDLPDTLVHGDFHPENVVVHEGRTVVFDWSDAAVAHPLVDAMTWSTWLEDDPARGERAWDAFLDAWADVVPAAVMRAARPALTGLTAAYHTVSYADILRRTEPDLRDELGGGLRSYGAALDAAVPR